MVGRKRPNVLLQQNNQRQKMVVALCRGQHPASIKLNSLLIALPIALAPTSVKSPPLSLFRPHTSDSSHTTIPTIDNRRRRRTGPPPNSPLAAMDSPDLGLPAALGIGPSAAIKAGFRRSAVPLCTWRRPSTHRAWPVRLIKTLA